MKSKDIKKTVLFVLCLPVLALFGQCYAGDKYVQTDGSDSNNGTAAGSNAWATIGKAITSSTSGDTIYIAAGTYNLTLLTLNTNSYTIIASGTVDINSTSTSSCISIPATATGSVTFSGDFHWLSYASTYVIRTYNANTGSGVITFTGNTFDVTGPNQIFFTTGTATNPLRKFIFNNCTMSITDVLDSYGMCLISDVNQCSFNGCNFTKATQTTLLASTFRLSGNTTLLEVNDCNINSDAHIIIDLRAVANSWLGKMTVHNNRVIGGTSFVRVSDGNVGLLIIEDNNIITTYAGNVFHIGNNVAGTPIHYIDSSVIRRNIITKDGTSGHIVLLGTNCRNPLFEKNILSNTDTDEYGLVIKSIGGNITGNIVKSSTPIYLCGASNVVLQHNTAYSIGSPALLINNNYGVAGVNNVVINNILDGSGGGSYAIGLTDPNDINSISNYNCFTAGTSGLALISRVTKTLSELRTWWATNGGTDAAKLNEANSIQADPCFVDEGNSIFSLKSGSLCLDSAQPIVGQENLVTHYTCDDNDTNSTILDTGRQNIGAWNPDGATVRDSCDMHVAGIVGGALSFNGTSDYVNTNSTHQQNSLTLTCWVKPNDGQPSALQTIFSRTVSDGNHFEIYLGTDGIFDANCFVNGVEKTVLLYQNAQSVSTLADGNSNWIMLTAVMPDCNISGTGNLLIGSSFSGSLDDLRIYNKALSADEVKALYEEVYPKPAGDLNGDYQVDFFDFAVLAGSYDGSAGNWLVIKDIADTWLECGLANQDNCWQ